MMVSYSYATLKHFWNTCTLFAEIWICFSTNVDGEIIVAVVYYKLHELLCSNCFFLLTQTRVPGPHIRQQGRISGIRHMGCLEGGGEVIRHPPPIIPHLGSLHLNYPWTLPRAVRIYFTDRSIVVELETIDLSYLSLAFKTSLKHKDIGWLWHKFKLIKLYIFNKLLLLILL